ncbi:MAG: DMT family transporter [Lachnospira sp.]|nr:DMT family transporter [Lachnospira sp.]
MMKMLESKEGKQRVASLGLLIAAFIWGTAFVAQSVGMDYVEPFTFQWARSFIGSAALIPVILVMNHSKKKCRYQEKGGNDGTERDRSDSRKLIVGGICCGVVLCIATSFQQIGIMYTSVGNAGFITSMYMILVPILSIFLHKRVKLKIWICVAVAAVGMYFLSVSETLTISKGDILVAVSAFFFAVQIMAVDYFAPQVDGVKLSCIQFLVVGIISLVISLFFENPSVNDIISAAVPILYAGVLSSGVAYTLQIIGQKYAPPTTATLLMSLESVFSLLGGIVVLQQIPTGREVFGCILVFAAVAVSQVDLKLCARL